MFVDDTRLGGVVDMLKVRAAIQRDLGGPGGQQLYPSQQCVLAEKKTNRILGFLSKKEANRSGEVILPLYSPLVRPCCSIMSNSGTPAYKSKSSGGQPR